MRQMSAGLGKAVLS